MEGTCLSIQIFTTNTCAYCGMVKKYLTAKGHSYDEINLDDQPEMQQEALRLSGALTVPVTVVTRDSEQQVITGYNLALLSSAIQ